jgi:SPP1 gp7 family putative phage head morphogenesis protein
LQAAKPWAKAVGISNAEHTFAVQHALDIRRDASIRLVENANRVYADDVREIFGQPGTFGLRVEELQKLLLERAEVSVSRAELIARDQTLKTYAGVAEAQQKEAGVTQYVWSTSQDERVRENHQALEGQPFDWSNPPPAGNNGEPLAPGEDYQCRCVAIAIIPGA